MNSPIDELRDDGIITLLYENVRINNTKFSLKLINQISGSKIKSIYIDQLIEFRDSKGYSISHWASYNNNKILLNEIIKLSNSFIYLYTLNNQTILHICIEQNNIDILNLLIECTLYNNKIEFFNQTNKWNENVLHIAALNGSKEIIESLINTGVNKLSIDHWNRTPYHIAKELGRSSNILDILNDSSIIEKLSDYICNNHINDKIKDITDEFINKVKNNNNNSSNINEIITVKNIFNFNHENIYGNISKSIESKPIIKRFAISQKIEHPGDKSSIQSMLTDINIYDPAGKDMYGLTALHKLSSWNNTELIELLLPHLAASDLNSQCPYGFTALHYCVEMKAFDSLNYLLSHSNIRTDIKDKRNRTALDLAKELNLIEYINILNNYGLI